MMNICCSKMRTAYMLICSNCGSTSPDGTKFCPNCGASLGTQKRAGCFSGCAVVVLVFLLMALTISMCRPKMPSTEPVQTTKLAETAHTANRKSSETKTNSVRPQKDGFNNLTNKTVVIGSYQIKVPAYFKKGAYSNAKKTYDAEAESGEKCVTLSIELLPGSYSYDSLNATKETIFNNINNSLNASGVESSGIRFSDYNSKLGKGIMAEQVQTIMYNGVSRASAYSCHALIPVKGGCLVFNLLQSNQSEWIYTNDFEKIINSVEIKKSTPTKKPKNKKKATKKSTSKKSSKKTTKKRK